MPQSTHSHPAHPTSSSPVRPRRSTRHRLWREVLGWLLPLFMLGGLGALIANPAHAAEDPPGRVGRITWVEGEAQLQHADGSEPLDSRREALQNWPLTSGDVIQVGERSRAEIGIGSTRLRLAEGSQLLLRRIDDEAIELDLIQGSLALRVRSAEVARELSIHTTAARLAPLGIGLFRIDAFDAGTSADPHGDARYAATTWRSALLVDQATGSYTLSNGQRAELYVDGGLRITAPEADAFARWAMVNDDVAAPTTAQAHSNNPDAPPALVTSEMTGADQLDRYGDWTRSPDWGWVWLPRNVPTSWVPYRQGRWIWSAPWGWTWIDDAPWGFAPFHYGRWVWWQDRWGWLPGAYNPRPVYAPALVVWNGNFGNTTGLIGFSSGLSWFPLGPREVYVPPYRSSPRRLREINQPHVTDPQLLRRVAEQPDDVLRHAPFRYSQFTGAISTPANPVASQPGAPGANRDLRGARDGRDVREIRGGAWTGEHRVNAPPRLLSPAAPLQAPLQAPVQAPAQMQIQAQPPARAPLSLQAPIAPQSAVPPAAANPERRFRSERQSRDDAVTPQLPAQTGVVPAPSAAPAPFGAPPMQLQHNPGERREFNPAQPPAGGMPPPAMTPVPRPAPIQPQTQTPLQQQQQPQPPQHLQQPAPAPVQAPAPRLVAPPQPPAPPPAPAPMPVPVAPRVPPQALQPVAPTVAQPVAPPQAQPMQRDPQQNGRQDGRPGNGRERWPPDKDGR